jgi:catechol 2,3-dioxygenase-like lactoylglutathione lyase family enzyme
VSDESRSGAVLFATRVERVAAFYARVLGLTEAGRDDDHIVLESSGFQLVVHQIPGRPAAAAEAAEKPARRAGAAFKPVFFVRSVAQVRAIVNAYGGAMEPPEQEWRFNGALVCDALDPDGNVIQFRETSSTGNTGSSSVTP